MGKTGLGQTFKQLAKLKKEFVPPDINLLRVKIPYMNRGKWFVLLTLDPGGSVAGIQKFCSLF